jgi:hypothetical protein
LRQGGLCGEGAHGEQGSRNDAKWRRFRNAERDSALKSHVLAAKQSGFGALFGLI